LVFVKVMSKAHQPFLFYINQSTPASTPTYIISSYSPPYFKEGVSKKKLFFSKRDN